MKLMNRFCVNCKKRLTKKQKKCCSVKCQSVITKIRQTKPRVKTICLNCKNVFLKKEKSTQKYCKRKCVDEHKKTIYLGQNNPMYGSFWSKNKRQKMISLSRENYYKLNVKERFDKAHQTYLKKFGAFPGHTQESKQKRLKTFIKKYGVKHNWSDYNNRIKCEQTCIKKYKKHSWQIATEVLHRTHNTNIEKIIIEILKNNNIEFKKQFAICYNKTKYKFFDFYCPDYNLLIEADGDYWHANPIKYKALNEIQKINVKNDQIKNTLANMKKYNLLRFYESEIKDINFFNILIFKIKQYEKI